MASETYHSFTFFLHVLLWIFPNNIVPVQSAPLYGFGITTTDDIDAGTSATMVITLWHNQTIYQCDLSPDHKNRIYSCGSFTTVGVSDVACHDPEYKVMFDNSQTTDAVIIDSFSFCETNDNCYGADGYCPPQTDNLPCFSPLCIDNEPMDCGPGKQIVFFDMDQPNVYINDATWMDGSSVVISEITCPPTPIPTTTIPTTNIPTTNIPTQIPSNIPTLNPTKKPSQIPTVSPSNYPTFSPSVIPTEFPSRNPSVSPTDHPSVIPTKVPSLHPTTSPLETTVTEVSSNTADVTSDNQSSSSDKKRNKWIIISVILITLSLVGCLVICWCFRKRIRRKDPNKLDIDDDHYVELGDIDESDRFDIRKSVSSPQRKNTFKIETKDTINISKTLFNENISDDDIYAYSGSTKTNMLRKSTTSNPVFIKQNTNDQQIVSSKSQLDDDMDIFNDDDIILTPMGDNQNSNHDNKKMQKDNMTQPEMAMDADIEIYNNQNNL